MFSAAEANKRSAEIHYVDLIVTVAITLKRELRTVGRDGRLIVGLGSGGQALAIAPIQIDLKNV